MNYSKVIIDSGRLNIKGGGIRRALPQDARRRPSLSRGLEITPENDDI